MFDYSLYLKIMSAPEGLPHREYAKALGRYVSTLSEEERQAVLRRRDEILDAEQEWKELNEGVLLRLGFTEDEAGTLYDKRLDSPGMRMLLKVKCEVEKLKRKAGKR